MLIGIALFLLLQGQLVQQSPPPAAAQSETEEVKPPSVPQYRILYLKKLLIKKGFTPARVKEFFDDPRLYLYREPPERSIDWEELEKGIMLPESIERGKRFLERHKETLARAHKVRGVAPEYTVAVFRIESDLESFFGNHHATSVFYYKLARSCPKKKPECWKEHAEQFVALLLYCKQAGKDCHAIKSSHEGAYGIGQFMPKSYLCCSEDGDRDGVIDLFNPDDAIMSTAKFLKKHGWKKSKERALISYYGPRGSRHYRRITLNYAAALKKK